MRQCVVKGVQVIPLLGHGLDVFIQLLLVLLVVLKDEHRCIVDEEEASLNNVDGLASQHCYGGNARVHSKRMRMYLAMILEQLVHLQSIFDISSQ